VKKGYFISTLLFLVCCYKPSNAQSQLKNPQLRVIIIRHGEEPSKGDNLSCLGLNRALQLPAVLYSKFGIPDYTYVPTMEHSSATKHARMFQTVIPIAVKYNLRINSKYDEMDSINLAIDIKSKNGTVLLVWDHKAIPSIVRALGVVGFELKWEDGDYDSIWIINFTDGTVFFSADKQGIIPKLNCPGSK
jgi:hypothetical protein